MNAGNKLRALMKKRAVVVAGVYDCLSARVAEEAGYEALYISGGALSVSLLGEPDIGLLTLDEWLARVRAIVRVVSIPVLADADTGFGGLLNIQRLLHEVEATGAAGIQLEDQTFPKRCGHLRGKKLISPQNMVRKIRLAARSRANAGFLLMARTDARAREGLQGALFRAKRYKEAGADVIFPEALASREEFAAFSQKGLGELLANMTEFGLSPLMPAAEVARLGYKLILYPVTTLRIAAKAMEGGLKDLQKRGTNQTLLGRMQTRRDLYRLNRYAQFDKIEENVIEEAHLLLKKYA